MNVLINLDRLATAIDLVTQSSVFFKDLEETIINPNISYYTKAEVDLKLEDLDLKKLDRAEYDKTLEEVLRATGYKDVEEFSEEKTYYLGDLVKVRTVDPDGYIIWTYYRYTKVHTPSIFVTSDCVLTNLYLEILSLKQLDVETVYLHISTEKGDVTLSDYYITYKYDELVYHANISSNGECQFLVPKGKNYILIFPLFEGYTPKESMYLYASISTKSLYINYTVLKLEVETVTIKGLVYDSSGKESDEAKTLVLENAEFTLVIDGETKEVKKFDSLSLVLYFNVPIGSSYVIKCNNISQYVSPASTVREIADLSTKRFEFVFTYMGSDSGWMAISKSGKLYDLDTISVYRDDELKALNIVALRFSNSVLSTEDYNAAFWVPLLYVYNGSWRLIKDYLRGNYYKSDTLLDPSILPNCNKSITQLAGYYPSIDGYENTKRLRVLASRSTYSESSYWQEFTKILRSEDSESDFPSIIADLTCGDAAYWVIDNNFLYIMGEGSVYSYDTFDLTPWNSYNGKILGIYIGSKITSIGNNCFSGFTSGGELDIIKVVCFADIIPQISETTFATYIYLGTLYVPVSTFTILDSGIIATCDLSSLPIDGYKCIPFIPAINLLVLLNANYKVLLDFFKKWYKIHYGVDNYTLTYPYSGTFWSSSLTNGSYAYHLREGAALSAYGKSSIFRVVPFFALSPLAVTNS